jgi:hypothetical protein
MNFLNIEYIVKFEFHYRGIRAQGIVDQYDLVLFSRVLLGIPGKRNAVFGRALGIFGDFVQW